MMRRTTNKVKSDETRADALRLGLHGDECHRGSESSARKQPLGGRTKQCSGGPLAGDAVALGAGETGQEFVNLNRQVLRDLSAVLARDAAADLSGIAAQYMGFIAEINELGGSLPAAVPGSAFAAAGEQLLSAAHSSVHGAAGVGDSGATEACRWSRRVDARPVCFPTERTHLCDVLRIFFLRAAAAANADDSLAQLLDAIEQSDEQPNIEFNYIRLKDVIKSKGNSINGPKREDVGHYNRKLFDMREAEQRELVTVSVSPNPNFYAELDAVTQRHEAMATEACYISYFRSGCAYALGLDEFFLVLFKDWPVTVCTVRNGSGVLFERLIPADIVSAHVPGSCVVRFIYLPAFAIYEAAFISPDRAARAYSLFFSQCASAD
ncbi:hypothetical protein PAPHI01_0696 [Pancytospora philotis]|nr:hypothetical protein PAPHI01_0696 [Pancytospora philotis]